MREVFLWRKEVKYMTERINYTPGLVFACQQEGTAVEGKFPGVDKIDVHDLETGEINVVSVEAVVVTTMGTSYTVFEAIKGEEA